MKLLTSKVTQILGAFILGGVLSYFVTSYIHLKTQSQSKETVKLVEGNAPRVTNNLMSDDLSRDPFRQMDQMHNQIRKRMNNFFGSSFLDDPLFNQGFMQPNILGDIADDDIQVNNYEDDQYSYIEIVTDKIDQKTVNVDVIDGVVTITAETVNEKNDSSLNSRSMSSYFSKFSKSFPAPYGVDENKVEIDNEDNKIVIKFPKDRF